MKRIYHYIIFAVILFLSSTITLGQNSYKFIEPNISFSYDSTKLKITNRYSNTFYEYESYDFKLTIDSVNKVNINVSAKHPLENPPSTSEHESMMQSKIAEFSKTNDSNVSFVDYDKKVRHIGAFLCVGFILLDNKANKTFTTIRCIHISQSDMTEIKLTSFNRQSLNADYEILEQFLKGFSNYSKDEISKEDSLIKGKYTINISQTTETIENLKWRRNSYFAIVRTNEQLQHKVKEVRLDIEYGREIFPANENGEVYIACADKEKGIVERKGELILLTSFGKHVKIPFTLKYENK
ncbi:MAG: hypothetical protein ABIN36_05320 [Ferruginibacter sp.]